MVSSKNLIFTTGGFFDCTRYLSSGVMLSNFKGRVFIKVLNLFISPYFSLIGNLGNSNLSLVSSITPECCPKAYLNPKLFIKFLNSELYSPNGYEKKSEFLPNFSSKILIDFKMSFSITSLLSSTRYS